MHPNSYYQKSLIACRASSVIASVAVEITSLIDCSITEKFISISGNFTENLWIESYVTLLISQKDNIMLRYEMYTDTQFNSFVAFQKELMIVNVYMDSNYPGLMDVLSDLYASIYLNNKGIVDLAYQFLLDQIYERGGSIELGSLDITNNPIDAYIFSAIIHLFPYVTSKENAGFIDSINTMIVSSGINNGADARYLDLKLLEIFEYDIKWYGDLVGEGSYYKWQEENKAFLGALAEISTRLAYGAMHIVDNLIGVAHMPKILCVLWLEL